MSKQERLILSRETINIDLDETRREREIDLSQADLDQLKRVVSRFIRDQILLESARKLQREQESKLALLYRLKFHVKKDDLESVKLREAKKRISFKIARILERESELSRLDYMISYYEETRDDLKSELVSLDEIRSDKNQIRDRFSYSELLSLKFARDEKDSYMYLLKDAVNRVFDQLDQREQAINVYLDSINLKIASLKNREQEIEQERARLARGINQ